MRISNVEKYSFIMKHIGEISGHGNNVKQQTE
jgi:hypothetical protein